MKGSQPLREMRLAGRAIGARGRSMRTRAKRSVGSVGFPYRAPEVPRGVTVPELPSRLEANYETAWAREAPARAVRRALVGFGTGSSKIAFPRLATRAAATPASSAAYKAATASMGRSLCRSAADSAPNRPDC